MTSRSLLCLGLFLLSVCSGPCLSAEENPASPQPKPVPIRKFLIDLQKLGGRFQPGRSSARSNAARTQLIQLIEQEYNGKRLTFTTAVTNVKWKDEIAAVKVTYGTGRSRAKLPLKIIPHSEFLLHVSQEEALKIRPNAPLVFTGTLEFLPGKWGAVGLSTKSQQLHTLSHTTLRGSYLGTFISRDYTITIDRQEYTGRWIATDESSPEETDDASENQQEGPASGDAE